MSDEGSYSEPSSSGHTSASMEPVNSTASASSSSGQQHAAAGAGGGSNGVFGGLFGFNAPGGNGRVQHKVGVDDAGRAASAVVAAAAAMAERLPRGSGGSGGGFGPTGGS